MISENYSKIVDRVNAAADRVGHKNGDVQIVAVSKTFPISSITAGADCGISVFGENKIQEALPKIEYFHNYHRKLEFHFIGHLQTNKVKYLSDKFSLIHSVDRVSLVEEMEFYFNKIDNIQDVLVQINLVGESQKSGVALDSLDDLINCIYKSKHIVMKGFMFIPPFENDPEENRILFRKLFEIYSKYKYIYNGKFDNISIDILSMGMSDDFEIAVEEGSNMVRVGSAIFGNRHYD